MIFTVFCDRAPSCERFDVGRWRIRSRWDSTFAGDPSVARGRRRRSFITRAIAAENIRNLISLDIRAFCKRTPMTATTGCICQTASPARLSRLRAGAMPGARSSPWRISRRTSVAWRREEGNATVADRHRNRPPYRCAVFDRAVDHRQVRRRTSRHSPGVEPAARRCAGKLHARTGRKTLARARSRQSDALHAQTFACLHGQARAACCVLRRR
jgi:hypothetical protein